SFFLMPGYGQRMYTIVDAGADTTGSATARWDGMVLASYVMLEHPFLGVGLKQHGLRFMDWIGDWSWVGVHNVFPAVGADLGVPALLLYLAALWHAFKGVRRSLERLQVSPDGRELGALGRGIEISILAFVVGAFFHPVAYHFHAFYIMGFAVAFQ